MTLLVDLHLTDHTEPVHIRIEGAEPVGERLREHGYHMPGEIDRIAPHNRLAIQRTLRLNVVRDIGNRNQQTPPLCGTAAVDRIIKVPRILPIDGYQRGITKILAPLFGLFRNLCRD